MRRVLIIAIYCACICFSTRAADESPATWTAWLHYGRHMTLIDSNGGTLREVDLPVPDGYELLDKNIAVSTDGNIAAYATRLSQKYMGHELNIYDLVRNEIIKTFKFDGKTYDTALYIPGVEMFDNNNTTFAYGYAWIDPQTNLLRWDLMILNLFSGEVMHEITEMDLQYKIGDSINYGEYLTLIIRRYDDLEVIFTLLGDINTYSYIWNTIDDTIRQNVAYPESMSSTFLPTNEVIVSYYDVRFPPPPVREPPLIPNSLHIYDPINHSRYPFFVNEDLPPYQADFVQNGQRVLVRSSWAWILMERDGTIIDQNELPHNHRTDKCQTIPLGCVYSLRLLMPQISETWSFWADIPAVYEVNTRDDKLDVGRVVWQIPMKEFHSYFEPSEQPFFDIAWVHSDEPVGPFKPWAQLAEPVYAPTPQPSDIVIIPTLIPTPPPLFHVGQTVRVQTIDGEILNLRAEPTRKSEIVVYIEDDTHLELLEGPVAAEGFSWWRVRLPDGLEGWVVENDGELQTLMPHSP